MPRICPVSGLPLRTVMRVGRSSGASGVPSSRTVGTSEVKPGLPIITASGTPMMLTAAAFAAVTLSCASYTRMPSFAESMTARKRASPSRSAASASRSASRSSEADKSLRFGWPALAMPSPVLTRPPPRDAGILMRVQPLSCGFMHAQRNQRFQRGRRDAGRAREPERRYELGLDLHRPAALVVLQHRRLVGDHARAVADARTLRRGLEGNAVLASDG